jgi:hypothetical protein
VTPRIPVPPGWPTVSPAPAGGPATAGGTVPQQFAPAQWHGYSYPPAAPNRVAKASRLSHRSLFAGLFGLVGGFVVILIIVSVIAKPGAPAQCQTLTCAIPFRTGPPVETGPLYTNSQFGFTARVIENPILGVAPTMSTANGQLSLTYSVSSGELGTVQLVGQPDTNGETAEQIVDSVINSVAQGQQQSVYSLGVGAQIGYQPGFGEVYNVTPDSGDGQSQQLRVTVIAAVVNKLAIVAVAEGVYQEFTPSFGPSHPSPADSLIAEAADPVINSVLWPGETSLFGS